MLRLLVIVLVAVSAAPAFALSVANGASRDHVLSVYGYPSSQLMSGGREIFIYREGSVVFRDGKVTELRFTHAEPRLIHSPTAKPADVIVRPAQAPATTRVSVRESRVVAPTRRPTVVPLSIIPAPLTLKGLTSSFAVRVMMALSLIALFGVFAVKAKKRKSFDSIVVPPVLPPANRVQASEVRGETPSGSTFREPEEIGSTLTPELLLRLEWRRFEELIHGYFEAQGLKPQRSSVGADGGIDIYLYREPGRPVACVQCKAKQKEIDVKLIREFFGVMSSERIVEGYFVSTSGYTQPARKFAQGNGIHLWSQEEIVLKVGALALDVRADLMKHVFREDFETPTCPSCDIKMVKRDASRPFWSCRRFPRCRTTLTPRRSL